MCVNKILLLCNHDHYYHYYAIIILWALLKSIRCLSCSAGRGRHHTNLDVAILVRDCHFSLARDCSETLRSNTILIDWRQNANSSYLSSYLGLEGHLSLKYLHNQAYSSHSTRHKSVTRGNFFYPIKSLFISSKFVYSWSIAIIINHSIIQIVVQSINWS